MPLHILLGLYANVSTLFAIFRHISTLVAIMKGMHITGKRPTVAPLLAGTVACCIRGIFAELVIRTEN